MPLSSLASSYIVYIYPYLDGDAYCDTYRDGVSDYNLDGESDYNLDGESDCYLDGESEGWSVS